MKKFAYRLEKVLRYREYLEKKAQKRLIDTLNSCQIIENSIKEIEKKQKLISQNCSKEKRKVMDVMRYQNYNLYFKKLNDDQQKESLALNETQEAVLLHRSLLEKELIRKKQLEKLKKVQTARYIQYVEKEEQKQSDEMALIRTKRVLL